MEVREEWELEKEFAKTQDRLTALASHSSELMQEDWVTLSKLNTQLSISAKKAKLLAARCKRLDDSVSGPLSRAAELVKQYEWLLELQGLVRARRQ
jgi:endonuclease III